MLIVGVFEHFQHRTKIDVTFSRNLVMMHFPLYVCNMDVPGIRQSVCDTLQQAVLTTLNMGYIHIQPELRRIDLLDNGNSLTRRFYEAATAAHGCRQLRLGLEYQDRLTSILKASAYPFRQHLYRFICRNTCLPNSAYKLNNRYREVVSHLKSGVDDVDSFLARFLVRRNQRGLEGIIAKQEWAPGCQRNRLDRQPGKAGRSAHPTAFA